MEAQFLVDDVTELFKDATEPVSREFILATHVRPKQAAFPASGRCKSGIKLASWLQR